MRLMLKTRLIGETLSTMASHHVASGGVGTAQSLPLKDDLMKAKTLLEGRGENETA